MNMNFKVTKYELKSDMILCETLFVKGDIIYIQNYDPESGSSQFVFAKDKIMIGRITSKFFYDIKEFLEELR